MRYSNQGFNMRHGWLGFVGRLTIYSNANICLLQGRSIIDAVTSHANHVMGLLKHLHNHELMLGEHFSEAISPLDQVLHSGKALRQTPSLLGLQPMGRIAFKLCLSRLSAAFPFHSSAILSTNAAAIAQNAEVSTYNDNNNPRRHGPHCACCKNKQGLAGTGLDSHLVGRHRQQCDLEQKNTSYQKGKVYLAYSAGERRHDHLEQDFSVEDGSAHAQLLGSFSTNQGLVTSDHFYPQALQRHMLKSQQP